MLLPEAYPVFSETLKMKDFVTVIGKRSTLHVCGNPGYASYYSIDFNISY